jgi:hypothetical protein
VEDQILSSKLRHAFSALGLRLVTRAFGANVAAQKKITMEFRHV